MYDHWNHTHTAPNHRSLPPEAEVVSRRINVPAATALAAVGDPEVVASLRRRGLSGRGWLTIDPPLERTGELDARRGRSMWHGRGRLWGRGIRLVRYARVEIEISAWSTRAAVVWLRPTCRHAHRWGPRRWRRYFDLANMAGDEIARVLTDAALNVPREQDRVRSLTVADSERSAA